jgi:NADPH-dependent curcumin reductase
MNGLGGVAVISGTIHRASPKPALVRCCAGQQGKTMAHNVNRQWLLKTRPTGPIEADTFELRQSEVPRIGPGEFLVRNLWLSFDPAQRGWLNDLKSYVPPVAIGEPMRAGAVGQVIASNTPDFAPGQLVLGAFGWQDYIATKGTGLIPVTKLSAGVPPNKALSVLGLTGSTAYFGMLEIGRPQPGDTVVVSSAAGATGSAAGQIAKIQGAKSVIGIAGGKEKCRWLTREAHFDAAIDYKSEDVGRRLAELAPNGINIYFDNVGGQILNQCLAQIAFHGRIVLCGGISSGYGRERSAFVPLSNYFMLTVQSARMEGFIVLNYAARFSEAVAHLAAWVDAGKIAYREDIAEGLENAPETLKRLFVGANFGKQLLKIADPPLPVA